MSQRVTSIALAEVLVDALKESAAAGDERTAYLLAVVAFQQLDINLPPPSADGADGGAAGCLLAIVKAEQGRFLERLAAKRKADNKRNRDGSKPDSGTIRERFGNDSGRNRERFDPDSEPPPLPLPFPEQIPKNKGVGGAQKRTRTKFTPPTLDAVREFIEAEGLATDAERFYQWHEARKWKGIQDWQAEVRCWHIDDAKRNQTRAAITQTGGADNGGYF